MKLELPVRLQAPLTFCVYIISLSELNFLDALGFGLWKYIIGTIVLIVAMWLLHKSGINEKEVPIWVGALIFILGFTIAIILEKLIAIYL